MSLPRRPSNLIVDRMSTMSKFLAIAVLLLTSLGMTATASAAAAPHHGAAAMPMEHCPDQGGKAGTNGGVPQCAMACSAALPVAEFAPHALLRMSRALIRRATAHQLDGLNPETATPPPKGS